MRLVQLPAAEAEVDDAVAYYEQKKPGLVSNCSPKSAGPTTLFP